MKNIITLIILTFLTNTSNSQVSLNDFGRIIINTYLPDNISLPADAKNLLANKLNQITSNIGMGGSQTNPRFIITVNINVGTKDIISGPPQMIAQNLDITFFVGDAVTNTIFSSTTLSLKGVGTNENKSFIDALKTINPKNKELLAFFEDGKTKIINYYSTNCDFIIKNAQTSVKQGKYDEAICQLSIVPEVCKDCYFKCLDTLTQIYQQKIDADCKVKFNQAKIIWSSSQSQIGAEKVVDILKSINPLANCQTEIKTFFSTIETKLNADEKIRWKFKMKQYADQIEMQKERVRIDSEKGKRDDEYRENQSTRNFELDKIRANSYREVALEQAKNQPKTAIYNNIYWR